MLAVGGGIGIVGLAVVVAVVFGGIRGGAGRASPAARPRRRGSVVPAVKGGFPGLALDAITLPVRSLSPALAGFFRQGRTAHDTTVTGFVFRNREDPSLCLTAVNTGPTAGQNRDPILVTAVTTRRTRSGYPSSGKPRVSASPTWSTTSTRRCA